MEGGLLTYIDPLRHKKTSTHKTRNYSWSARIHTNMNEHLTIANLYIPPRDTASPHYVRRGHNILH